MPNGITRVSGCNTLFLEPSVENNRNNPYQTPSDVSPDTDRTGIFIPLSAAIAKDRNTGNLWTNL
jgi:hypothetical protein